MDSLAKVFAECMMRAAIEYCAQQRVPVNAEHLSSCLRTMSPRIKSALADAKEAIDAHMPQVAEATFRASAAIAGIDAAKEYVKEHSPRDGIA